jgi:glycosyltransferase involved in cell wall biosynthesis
MADYPYIECSDASRLVTNPLVSVFMTTYNHERYLAEAIEGIIAQERDFPIEIVIGEDCSTDGTRDIALSYQKRFPEIIRLIMSDHNVGMHANGLRTIVESRGKYIAFCEGDDVWIRPDKLKRQVAVLEGDPDINLVCSNYQVISDNGDVIIPDMHRSSNAGPYYVTFDEVMFSGTVLTVTVCARLGLINKALVESPLCRKQTYPFGDSPMWVELTRWGKCCVLPEVYASYRRSAISATRGLSPVDLYKFSRSVFEFHNDVLNLYPLPQGDAATMRAKVSNTRSYLRCSAVCGDLSTAMAQFQRLKELGVQPTIKDRLLCLVAYMAQPGSLASPFYDIFVFVWRSFKILVRTARGTSGRPIAPGPSAMEYTWACLRARVGKNGVRAARSAVGMAKPREGV